MRSGIVVLLLLANHCLAAPPGLGVVLKPEDLARPVHPEVRMAATTAAEGEGEDHVLLQPGDEEVIVSIEGPAVIHRIWSTSSFPDETRLVMKVDGRDETLWERGELPEGISGDDPLRGLKGLAYWSYVPVRVNSEVELIATDLRPEANEQAAENESGSASEAEGNKFYLQVEYSRGSMGCVSDEQLDQVRERLKLFTTRPLAGSKGLVLEGVEKRPKSQRVSLGAGAPVTISGEEKDYIQAMIIHTDNTSFDELKHTRLLMTPKGAVEPCVDVPVPYLFGAYWEPGEYAAPLTAVQEGALVFRFPIPVGEGLELRQERFGDRAGVEKLDITLVRGVSAEPIPYRFCAEYRSSISKRGEPVRLAQIEGEGVFLGGTFAAKAFHHRRLAFLEGNEQVYVDGDEEPTWEGTGTEDYFNGAWYFRAGCATEAFHGLTCLEQEPPPRMSAYRYLVPDRIGFKKRLRVEMQHGSRNSVAGVLYQTVNFWYQKPPCTVLPAKQPPAAPPSPGETVQQQPPDIDMVTPIVLSVIVLLFGVAAIRYVLRRRRERSIAGSDE